jgi:hypothetical protein
VLLYCISVVVVVIIFFNGSWFTSLVLCFPLIHPSSSSLSSSSQTVSVVRGFSECCCDMCAPTTVIYIFHTCVVRGWCRSVSSFLPRNLDRRDSMNLVKIHHANAAKQDGEEKVSWIKRTLSAHNNIDRCLLDERRNPCTHSANINRILI